MIFIKNYIEKDLSFIFVKSFYKSIISLPKINNFIQNNNQKLNLLA